MVKTGASRDQRVTIALKYHYLDGLDAGEIRDRFEEEGIGSYARSTIRDYLNEAPKEEVIEQIQKEQANIRERIIDRTERLYQEAEEAKHRSTEDDPIFHTVPETRRVDADRARPLERPAWEIVDVDDEENRPDWAEPEDIIVRFTEGRTPVAPGDRYPVQKLDGSPKYTSEFLGLERDVPDEIGQRFARVEQREHLELMGQAGGAFEHDTDADETQADALETIAENIDFGDDSDDVRELAEENDVEPDTMK